MITNPIEPKLQLILNTFLGATFEALSDRKIDFDLNYNLYQTLRKRHNIDLLLSQKDEKVCKYFEKVVIPHKIQVFNAGLDLIDFGLCDLFDIPTHQFINQLVVHDFSKFSDEESFGYANYNFKGENSKEAKKDFEMAWHHHKMCNQHHPEYWLNPDRSGELEILEIPVQYLVEMVADWIGAGKTYGSTIEQWLPDNLPKFKFHPESKKKLDIILEIIGIKL